MTNEGVEVIVLDPDAIVRVYKEEQVMIQKFRKKPVEVEALQWTGENLREVKEFTEGNIRQFVYGGDIAVYNILEKCYVDCPIKHWIIKGVKGEFYPCDPEVLAATYDEVKAPDPAEEEAPGS